MPTFIAGHWVETPLPEGPSQAAPDLGGHQPAPLPTPVGADLDGVVTILPYPMPGDGVQPGTSEALPGRVLIVAGGAGDDVLILPPGAAASGGGGADTFVLTSAGDAAGEGPERLGVIFDFGEGDTLDLSRLGEHAAIVGRGSDLQGGAERISIDYDGDGDEDGYVLLTTKLADIGDFYPMPMPEGEVTILPYPLPGDEGVFTILPFPLLGEGVSTAAGDWIAP